MGTLILSPALGGKAMVDNEERGLDELLKKLPAAEAKELVKSVVAMTLRELDKGSVPETFHAVKEMLGHTDAVMAEVEELRGRTGDTKEDLLLKALALFEAALEATQKGQRLVVVSPDYRFIKEIIGIDRVARAFAQSGDIADEPPYAHGKQVNVAQEPVKHGNIAG
jgi:hypothetical protein